MKYYFYKIYCEDLPDFVYVGSTKAFANRKREHKCACNNENKKSYNYKVYQTIRANGGWNNWRMVCIHEEDCETKRQAEIIEERYRLELNANMNGRCCYITEEQKKEYDRKYHEDRREEMKKHKFKKYTCACGSEIQWCNKAQHEKIEKHQNFLKHKNISFNLFKDKPYNNIIEI